jgi:hypothetical protein
MTRHPTTEFTPSPLLTSEGVRSIARDEANSVVGQKVAAHASECLQARDLWQTVNQLQQEQKTMAVNREGDRGEIRGAMRTQTRTLAILVAIVGGLGLAAQIVGMMLRVGR